MLPYINWELIKNNPKWIQGFSDPTGLLFTITTNLDIATIYGDNFKHYGALEWHQSLYDSLDLLTGNLKVQNNYEEYGNEYREYETGDEGVYLDSKVEWKNLYGEKELELKGRIIGGCLDCILTLIGTKFDKTSEFIKRYKEDGIIWYFDNCDLTNEEVMRAMWQLDQLGWFKYCKGIIFGRTGNDLSFCDISFKDSLKHGLEGLSIPVIYDADISHKSPNMPILNGALAKIISKGGKGSIEFELE